MHFKRKQEARSILKSRSFSAKTGGLESLQFILRAMGSGGGGGSGFTLTSALLFEVTTKSRSS